MKFLVLRQRIESIHINFRILWDMSISQLKVKYAASFLGIFWVVINPLLIMSAISFVFTIVFKVEIKNFFLLVLSGIYPWLFFSTALSEATCSILNHQAVLRQFNLPRAFLPLSTCISNFINFLFGWLVIYPVFLFFNPKIIIFFPLLTLIFLLNFVFLCGLGLSLSVLNIFSRDIEHLLGILLMFWLWVTPVFYSIDMVPVNFRWICNLNPMTPYITYYSDIIYRGVVPAFSTFAGIFFWATLSILSGCVVFLRLESKILKRI